MIITTSRKPSTKTRTFCKRLSRFTGCEYISRGKTGISTFSDNEVLLRVGEHRGNPGSFNFFLEDTCILIMRFSVALEKDISEGETPVIKGDNYLASAISKTTGLRIDSSSSRIIHVGEDIKFIECGEPFIILKLVDFRGEGIV